MSDLEAPNEFSFVTKVEVPNWKYCNKKNDSSARGKGYCDYMNGSRNECSCSLFDACLYSSYEWVMKCLECLEKNPDWKEE